MINSKKLTFYNLIITFEDELNKILNGRLASKVLSIRVRKRLKIEGILRYKNFKHSKNNEVSRKLYPSCLTSMILKGLLNEHDFKE